MTFMVDSYALPLGLLFATLLYWLILATAAALVTLFAFWVYERFSLRRLGLVPVFAFGRTPK